MDRDEQVLLERIAGRKLREIGDDHDLTPEGARQVIIRESARHVGELVARIWAAQLEDSLYSLALPAWLDDQDQSLALDYLRWVLSQLAEVGLDPLVRYVPTPDGSCIFAIEDRSFPKPRRTTQS